MKYDEALLKQKTLDLLKVFHAFCRENNLHYSVGYGTMLGAIRHKGFIPWDDDIDLIMKREDYNRLQKLASERFIPGYSLVTTYTDKDYYIAFAKVMDDHTTIMERPGVKCILGVFIDIFPLDVCPDDAKALKRMNQIVRRHRNNAMSLAFPYASLNIAEKIFKFLLTPFTTVQKELIRMDRKSQRYAAEKGTHYAFMGAKKLVKLPAAWIDDVIEIPFEDTQVCCIRNYDAYLSAEYGNYMQLPPLEQQKTWHYHYFVDLANKRSLEEIKQLMQQ